MSRDLLLSGVMGIAAGGAGTYALHRALWKTSEEQAQRIEALAGGSTEADSRTASQTRSLAKKSSPATLERYWRQRTAQSWNAWVDSIHARLLNAPKTAVVMVDDAKAAAAAFGGGGPESVEESENE